MVLNASDYSEITRVAQRVAAEMLRNMDRGTGGTVLSLPAYRIATVGGEANSGDETQIRADGDLTPVVAINATSVVVASGDRVLALWAPPHGIYIVNSLRSAAAGEWTPNFVGTGVSNANTTAYGVWTRIGRRVHVTGRAVLHSGGTWGSALQLAGLPFPTATYGGGVSLATIGIMYATSGAVSYPGQWILSEGQSQGPLYTTANLGAGSDFLAQMSATVPAAQADGDYVSVDMVYETDQ